MQHKKLHHIKVSLPGSQVQGSAAILRIARGGGVSACSLAHQPCIASPASNVLSSDECSAATERRGETTDDPAHAMQS